MLELISGLALFILQGLAFETVVSKALGHGSALRSIKEATPVVLSSVFLWTVWWSGPTTWPFGLALYLLVGLVVETRASTALGYRTAFGSIEKAMPGVLYTVVLWALWPVVLYRHLKRRGR